MRDYDAAQTAYTQRPQALLKAYNALRTRVNKGIEGLARVRNMQADAAKADDAQGLDAAILPPSIARADNDADAEDEDAPKKRTRRPRAKAAEAAE